MRTINKTSQQSGIAILIAHPASCMDKTRLPWQHTVHLSCILSQVLKHAAMFCTQYPLHIISEVLSVVILCTENLSRWIVWVHSIHGPVHCQQQLESFLMYWRSETLERMGALWDVMITCGINGGQFELKTQPSSTLSEVDSLTCRFIIIILWSCTCKYGEHQLLCTIVEYHLWIALPPWKSCCKTTDSINFTSRLVHS